MTPGISRQAFLRGALGAVAAGAVFEMGGAAAAPPNWAALAATLDGQVLLPDGGSAYLSAKQIFNTIYDGSAPAAVVAVKSVADVGRAVSFAAGNGLKVAPRAGGHSYSGASAASGAMVIDLRQLPGGVVYDDATGLVTTTPATGLYAVHSAVAAHGKTIPTGSCPTVGAAGQTLGGGLGNDARRYGLSCDALTSVSVVLPSGETVTASSGEHDDLFWALRGGGGGNFGVTTSLTFKTAPVTDTDVVDLVFTGAPTGQAIIGWHSWLAGADRSVWSMVDITSDGGSGAEVRVVLTCPATTGPRTADGLIAAVGAQPASNRSSTLSPMDLVTHLAGGSATAEPTAFLAGSDIITTLTPAAADAIGQAVSAWPSTAGTGNALIDPLDGAIRDVDASGSAFPWRSHAVSVQWYASTVDTAASQWLSTAHRAVQAYSAGAYVNYIEQNTTAARYFGGNLARLAAIRQKYDPGRVMYSGLDF